MQYPIFYTEEMKSISLHNNRKLRKKLNPPKGYILHHKDEAMRYTNPDRYIKWLEEDIEILSKEEHTALHFTGYHHTDEAKKKIGEASHNRPHSKHSIENRQKISEAIKGRKWFTDGIVSVMAFECPDGFRPGRVYQRKGGVTC